MSMDYDGNWTPGTETALEAVKRLLRDRIAPFLRSNGYKGSGMNFRRDVGEFQGLVNFQGGRGNKKGLAEFTVNLSARHRPTAAGYWGGRIGHWLPDFIDVWWRQPAGFAIDVVANDLLRALEDYGLVAINAALDQPEYPPDPTRRWTRTFSPVEHKPLPPGWPLTQPDVPFSVDRVLSQLESGDLNDQRVAIHSAMLMAPGDARTIAALLRLVEQDPTPRSRAWAVRYLAFAPVESETGVSALVSVQAADESLDVRIAARFSLVVIKRRGLARG